MSEAQNILVARNNTFVAESDLEAATRAIDLCFEKELTKAQGLNHDADQIRVELLTNCRNSLISHIERVVQPVSDDAFYQFLNKQDTEDSLKSLSRKREDSCQFEHEEKDGLGDFDTEDLIDQQASQRARELRKSARDEAQHLRDLRIAVIDRATSLAKRQVDVLTKSQQKNNNPRNGKDPDTLQRVSDEASARLNDIRDNVNMLCESLQKQGRESSVTVSVSSLDETVSNVRNALENPHDTSKTGQAIHERNEESGSSGDMKHLDVPDRFIQFLGQ